MKMSKKKKRALIVISTIVGVIALFLFVVFVPIGSDTDKTVINNDTDVAEETVNNEADLDTDSGDEVDISSLSRSELEKLVKKLQEENAQLQDEVDTYKILAEQTTQAISAPVISSSSSSDKETSDKSSSDKTEYKDSSGYYDENYKDYTSDDDEKTTPSTGNSSSESSFDTSDTGL